MNQELEQMFDKDGNFEPVEEERQKKQKIKENKKQIEKDADFVRNQLNIEFELKWRPSMTYARHRSTITGSVIHFGTDNGQLKNLKVARMTLLHEALHATGMKHNEQSRKRKFYSSLLRDKYTKSRMRDLGWEPPTDEEISEALKDGYKYRIYCSECDWEKGLASRTKLVKYPELYRCPRCKNELKSKEW